MMLLMAAKAVSMTIRIPFHTASAIAPMAWNAPSTMARRMLKPAPMAVISGAPTACQAATTLPHSSCHVAPIMSKIGFSQAFHRVATPAAIADQAPARNASAGLTRSSNTATINSPRELKIGATCRPNQSTTGLAAARMPFHTSPRTLPAAPAPWVMRSHAAEKAGARVPFHQSTTVAAAVWIPCHAASQTCFPVSVWVKNHTRPAVRAAIAVTITPIGLADIAAPIPFSTPITPPPMALSPPAASFARAMAPE